MPRQTIVDHTGLDNQELAEWTGWGWTNTVAAMNCPKCYVRFGHDCRTPRGRRAWPPHGERFQALLQAGYKANCVIRSGLGVVSEE